MEKILAVFLLALFLFGCSQPDAPARTPVPASPSVEIPALTPSPVQVPTTAQTPDLDVTPAPTPVETPAAALVPPECAPGWVVMSCDCELDVPGNYTINSAGLLGTGNGYCINITADDVVLDCANHDILSGQTKKYDGYGIYLRKVKRATVRNCNLDYFFAGIRLDESNLSTISGNMVNSNFQGIRLNGSKNNSVAGNIAGFNEYGIILENSSDGNNVSGNTAGSNQKGIAVSHSSKNRIENTVATNNRQCAIEIGDSTGNFVADNIISSGNFGIMVVKGKDNTLVGNKACVSSGISIFCDGKVVDGGGNACPASRLPDERCGVACGRC